MENMTSKELKKTAKELGVKNWWNLKKTELIAEIEKIQNVADDKNIDESTQEAPEKKPSNKKVDLIEYNGKTQSLSAWARELDMPGQTLYARLRISNWPVEKAFTTPTRRKKEEEA